MDTAPTQKEIDAVAHFIEAVREVKKSPFFVEEFSTLTLSMMEGDTKDQVTAHLPDPNVMKAVLVPFRRLWQQNEPCYFSRVSNILKKHIPFFRVFIDPIALDKSQDAVNLFPHWKNDKLSNEDIINVWLNTRYLHVGSSKECGKFNRSDFERLESQIGSVLFEYYFLLAVWKFGIYFQNILQFAEGFLSDLAKIGMEPSFKIASGNSDGRIQRATPGFTPATETPVHRVWCLRRRKKFAAFNNFLRIAGLTDDHVAELTDHCDSFHQVVTQAGIESSHQKEFEISKGDHCTSLSSALDTHSTAVRNGTRRRGLIGKKKDGAFVFTEDALAIINEHFTDFRRAFRKEPFQ